jgi:hypothetical protein
MNGPHVAGRQETRNPPQWMASKEMETMSESKTTAAMRPEARRDRLADGFALAAMLVAMGSFLAGAGDARAATYKWVDEKGVVHYSDKVPPEAVDRGNVELNKEGIPVKKTDPALTPEQRRALEQEAERQRNAERAREEIARRDRALVASYTSEAEIDLARNRSLQTINNVLLSSQAFSEQLNKRKIDVEAKKAESQGKPVVAVLDRELESIEAELARQAELIVQKKRESEMVTAKYDADKKRWRDLVAAKAAVNAANPGTGATKAAAPATGGAKK